MFEEAAEGGAPAVARGRRIRAVSFDVIEEGDDRVRVQVLESQRRDISALAVCRELEQKLHRIAVGSNRMRACPTLALLRSLSITKLTYDSLRALFS